VCPALHQDGPGCVSAIDFDTLAGSNGDRGGIQLLAQLAAEQIEHHSFSVTLLARTARRNLKTAQTRRACTGSAAAGSDSARLRSDVGWFSGAITGPFINDLSARTDLAPYHSGIT
jgi:hypothetical protein